MNGFLVDKGVVNVQTPVGEIVGKLHDIQFDGKQYHVKEFLGIPYAEPPTGDNRFKKPVPKSAFHNAFNASDFAPACLQGPSPVAKGAVLLPKSEDCLYLNIFVPVVSRSQNLPVMIWIHGGGFSSDSTHIYIGDVLCNYGEVIMVAIGYRLTYLGFLHTNEGNGGNFGLWDQHVAIKWVHDNIASFGGDTSRVTLFGESAGSSSVIFQSLYPGNKGLFQRGIAESGSITSPWAFAYNKSALDTFVKFSGALGCQGNNSEIMTCLRNKSSDDIQNYLMTERNNFAVVPNLDGEFIKRNPTDMFRPGPDMKDSHDLFHETDLLMGANSIDGAFLMPIWLSTLGLTDPELFAIPRPVYEKLFIPITLSSYYTNIPNIPDVAKSITAFEYTDWQNPDDNTARNKLIVQMATDYALNSPMIYTVNAHASNANSSSYLYKFSTRPGTHMLPVPSWLDGQTQAIHADEVGFVFGFSSRRSVQYQKYGGITFNVTAQDIRVSKAVMTMWTNFAKSG